MPVGYMYGSKRARSTPSIANKANCGGPIKGGLAPRVGLESRNLPAYHRAVNGPLLISRFCTGPYDPKYHRNPASSGGVGIMFTRALGHR